VDWRKILSVNAHFSKEVNIGSERLMKDDELSAYVSLKYSAFVDGSTSA